MKTRFETNPCDEEWKLVSTTSGAIFILIERSRSVVYHLLDGAFLKVKDTKGGIA